MAFDQEQDPDNITSTHHGNGKPSGERDDEKGTHRSTKASEIEKEDTDAQGSGNNDSMADTSRGDAEQVETPDAVKNSKSTARTGKKKKPQSESGKSDSAANAAGDDAGSIKVDDASKKSDETPATPEDVTTQSSGEAETSRENDFAFVEEICNKVRAIDLLDKIIDDPYNVEPRKRFSEAVDRLILEKQQHTGNTDNLLLPMNKIASLVVSHAKADEKWRRFRSYVEKEPSQSLKDPYERKTQEYERLKLRLKDEWKALLRAKCYPQAWSTKLEVSNDAIKIRWKSEEPSVTDLRDEVDKQKALACEIWGVSKIDDVGRSEHLSWALESHNAEKGSRKRGSSQDPESERPQKSRKDDN